MAWHAGGHRAQRKLRHIGSEGPDGEAAGAKEVAAAQDQCECRPAIRPRCICRRPAHGSSVNGERKQGKVQHCLAKCALEASLLEYELLFGHMLQEAGNPQLAWEALELAKVVYTRMVGSATGERKQELEARLCDAYLCLGEVSIENENYAQAVTDLTVCLAKRKAALPSDSRYEDCYDCPLYLDVACDDEPLPYPQADR